MFKLARWNSLDALATALGSTGAGLAVLGSLRFVIVPKLSNLERLDAVAELEKFLDAVEILEPSDDEVSLAAALEEAAALAGLEIDGGESLLLSIALQRAVGKVATGDKRALNGIATLAESDDQLEALRGRFFSLEQIVYAILECTDFNDLRGHVCADQNCDKAISICFQCNRDKGSVEHTVEALNSYQRDLSKQCSGFSAERLGG